VRRARLARGLARSHGGTSRRMMRHTLIALTIAGTAAAQQARPIDVGHPCRSCVLRIEKGPRLIDPTGGMGSWMNLAAIDRDSRGRYFVAVGGSHTNVLVFDSEGKLIKRIGRDGEGPGEFRLLESLLVGPGDTVHAFDYKLQRRSEISPTTLEVVRQAPIARVFFQNVMIPNGNFVGSSDGTDLTGRPFEELDRKGNRVRAFGGDGKPAPSYAQSWLGYQIFTDHRGGFFAVQRRNYAFEHWDAAGNLLGRWERNAPWFPRSEPVRIRKPWPQYASPWIFGAWVNAEGLLFIGSHVRQEGWEKAVVQGSCEGGVPCPTVEDYDKYYDSIIEVFDPTTSRLLASIRTDKAFTLNTRNGEMYWRGEDPDPYFDIYRVIFEKR
jgi:hypothetical protein